MYRGEERNVALERAEMGRERKEGVGEGRNSGQGERRAGRGEMESGGEKAQKKPNPLGLGLEWGGEGCLVSIEAAVGADSPRVNRWGWGCAYLTGND